MWIVTYSGVDWDGCNRGCTHSKCEEKDEIENSARNRDQHDIRCKASSGPGILEYAEEIALISGKLDNSCSWHWWSWRLTEKSYKKCSRSVKASCAAVQWLVLKPVLHEYWVSNTHAEQMPVMLPLFGYKNPVMLNLSDTVDVGWNGLSILFLCHTLGRCRFFHSAV